MKNEHKDGHKNEKLTCELTCKKDMKIDINMDIKMDRLLFHMVKHKWLEAKNGFSQAPCQRRWMRGPCGQMCVTSGKERI